MPASNAVAASVIASAFAALLLSAHLGGPIAPVGQRVLTAIALAAVVSWASRAIENRRARIGLVSSAALPLLLAWVEPRADAFLQTAIVVAVLAAASILTRGTRRHACLELVFRGAVFTALLLVLERHSAIASRAIDLAAAAQSALARAVSRQPLEVGPTHGGFWIAMLFAAMAIPLGRARLTRRDAVKLALAIAVALVLTPVLLDPLERLFGAALDATLAVPRPHRPLTIVRGQLATPLLIVPLAALSLLAAHFIRRADERESAAVSRRQAWVGGIGFAIVAAVLLLQPLGPRRAAEIVFLDDGTLDFSRPVPGRYTLTNVGMFGQLREYLDAAGYPTRVVRRPIESAPPDSVLVVINPQHAFSSRERNAIWDHLGRGGGLLVLGDHTDIFGITAKLDDLLTPVGIRFAFDSAFPLRKHWRFCQTYASHAITRGLGDQADTGIGTGASLVLRGTAARPLVTGRYAFSDLGNRANGGNGGFLGDYRYQLGERLGDAVLVAAAAYGRGRVVVFGDTTSIQPLELPFAYPFLERTFRYLAGERFEWPFALLLVIPAAAAALAWRARSTDWLLVAAVAIVVAEGVASALPAPEPAPLPGARTAVVDMTLSPGLPLEFFEEGAQGGLYTSLMRAGYLPVVRRPGDASPRDPALVVYAAPARIPPAAERESFARLLDRGGTALVIGGGDRRTAANELLARCGMSIGGYPLGNAVAKFGTNDVRFVDAWPLAGASIQAWASAYGTPIVGETRRRGRCIAIGDARLLEDASFEGEYDYNPGPVALVDALLKRERSGS